MTTSRTQVQTIYSTHLDSYQRMISAFRYPQGMQAFLATSGLLRDRLRVLDAGCGFGAATLALVKALRRKSLNYDSLDAFDLTPAMLARYRANVEAAGLPNVRVHEADVTALERLPAGWTGYDLILAAGMLEHVPKEQLAGALSGLRDRLGPGGSLVAFITRKSPETKVLIESWLHSERYTEHDLQQAFAAGGFAGIVFGRFPSRYAWLNRALHVVIGERVAPKRQS